MLHCSCCGVVIHPRSWSLLWSMESRWPYCSQSPLCFIAFSIVTVIGMLKFMIFSVISNIMFVKKKKQTIKRCAAPLRSRHDLHLYCRLIFSVAKPEHGHPVEYVAVLPQMDRLAVGCLRNPLSTGEATNNTRKSIKSTANEVMTFKVKTFPKTFIKTTFSQPYVPYILRTNHTVPYFIIT